MSIYADQRRAEARDLVKQFQARILTLESEGRSATADERIELDKWEADIQTAEAEAKRAERADEMRAISDKMRGEQAPTVEAARAERREPTEREMLVELLKGERRFFDSAFTSEYERRALQSEGGSVVPTSFADLVSVYQRTMDPTIEVATVWDTPNGAPLVIPRLTADAAGGGTVTAEGGGITLADATISQITLNAFKYASIQPYSTQIARDAAFGLEDLLAKTAGRQIGIAAGSAYAFANGSAGPNGYVAGGSAGHTATGTASGIAADTFFSPSDLVDLFHSVAVPWRAVGSWMVSTTALTKIRKFRDSQGMFQYDPGIAGAPQPTLLGRPIYENPSMAAVASVSKSVIFGDWSEYHIRRLPLRVDVSNEFLWGSDSVALRVILETDGDIAHPLAIRPMVSANT
jgi:HK97 family phage major capsid protein